MKEAAKKKPSKKTVIILCTVAFLVIAATAGVLCYVFCGSETSNGQEAAMAALQKALNGALNESGEQEPLLIAALEQKNGYELLSFKENDSELVARLKVYAPDVYSVAKALPQDGWDSEEALDKELAKRLITAPVIEKEIELFFVKNGDEYQPVLTSDFIDAYYGGILKLKEEYLLMLVEERK